MTRLDDLEAKKQLLIAQAEFDRLKLAIAVHDVRRIIRPALETSPRAASHSLASRVLGFVLPIFGASRLGRVVRGLSIALSVYRLLRGSRR